MVDALSALVFFVGVTFASLWVRSYMVRDRVERSHELAGQAEIRNTRFESWTGGLRWSDFHLVQGPLPSAEEVATWKLPPERVRWRWERQWQSELPGTSRGWRNLVTFSIENEREPVPVPARRRQVRVPHWCVALPCVLWPGIRWWRRRRKRWSPDFCSTCGYDLRSHAVGARCPECGTVVAADAPAVRPAG